jgi:monofunctional biosynthetic peptidoglycan transglycosylase
MGNKKGSAGMAEDWNPTSETEEEWSSQEKAPAKPGCFSCAFGLVLLALGLFFSAWLFWPVDVTAWRQENPRQTRFMQLRFEQALAERRPFTLKHSWVPLQRIPLLLQQAVIAAEDFHFYDHLGLDLESIRQTLIYNWQHKRWRRGASTLTQQLAKNLFLTPDRTWLRKLREAVLAMQLERQLGKKRILEMYLNLAEWGPGIFGVGAAAKTYFGVAPKDLTPQQMIALAAILPSPRKHNPAHPDRYVRWRTSYVRRQLGYMKVAVPESAADQELEGQTGLTQAVDPRIFDTSWLAALPDPSAASATARSQAPEPAATSVAPLLLEKGTPSGHNDPEEALWAEEEKEIDESW